MQGLSEHLESATDSDDPSVLPSMGEDIDIPSLCSHEGEVFGSIFGSGNDDDVGIFGYGVVWFDEGDLDVGFES